MNEILGCRRFTKLLTTWLTFTVSSHLPHCGVHYWMKMTLVILQIFYNFRSFFTFTTLWGSLLDENGIRDSSNFLQLSQFFTFTSLWGSLLNENSIGDSSNFLQLLQFLTFTAMFQTVLSVCNANMYIYNFPGYRTYSNTFHIDTDVFIHTLFIFKYVNDINLCQWNSM